ncbi:MAG: hypothetical protein F4226_02195 [Synechococcus sp. SB0678_bin_12]|nr:hypothetical protein [Cyanobacteria bacterium MAG IRC3_bin_20]MYF35626.1 hypothetical protein [Synechococcus sp. SB0678_bin_12]
MPRPNLNRIESLFGAIAVLPSYIILILIGLVLYIGILFIGVAYWKEALIVLLILAASVVSWAIVTTIVEFIQDIISNKELWEERRKKMLKAKAEDEIIDDAIKSVKEPYETAELQYRTYEKEKLRKGEIGRLMWLLWFGFIIWTVWVGPPG